MAKQKGMSFVEKAGLFFGIVGVMADFTALVSFTYGFANLGQFTPSHISSDAATSFFKWFSGLVIIYAWFITSWYLTRRTFVLRYEKPRGYKNPLDSRSSRTIFGVALLLVPIFIFWSIVNVSFSSLTIHPTSLFEISPTVTATTPPTFEAPKIEKTEIVNNGSNLNPSETAAPTSTSGIITSSTPATTSVNDQRNNDMPGTVVYYMFIFPFVVLFFGIVIYASINLLMPIVHVELLDDYE